MSSLETVIADLGHLNSPYIDGRCVGPTRAGTTTHVDPSTGRAVAVAHLGDAHEIAEAVESAQAAQKVWIALPPSRRAAVLQRFAELIEQDEAALCDVLALDAGVPVSMGISLATAWVRHFAGWAEATSRAGSGASVASRVSTSTCRPRLYSSPPRRTAPD
jgi:acyl-CoA reductase-like NAD-dependent aldehyde dehydrogenase